MKAQNQLSLREFEDNEKTQHSARLSRELFLVIR
uniref:Uncharacterized protein n=1 Tax=Rhizophora mucronata TaxID=61149 RepID=A0A2P2QCH5_RHIMU